MVDIGHKVILTSFDSDYGMSLSMPVISRGLWIGLFVALRSIGRLPPVPELRIACLDIGAPLDLLAERTAFKDSMLWSLNQHTSSALRWRLSERPLGMPHD